MRIRLGEVGLKSEFIDKKIGGEYEGAKKGCIYVWLS